MCVHAAGSLPCLNLPIRKNICGSGSYPARHLKTVVDTPSTLKPTVPVEIANMHVAPQAEELGSQQTTACAYFSRHSYGSAVDADLAWLLGMWWLPFNKTCVM
jgi:hypothetical protein